MTERPLISVLMNCFNGQRYLRESIESILSQSYKNWELIFWDNNSTDKSLEIASLYSDKRIRIFSSKEHTNLGTARKNAFLKTRGEYLAFLDVDDIWNKDKLINQIKVFDNKEVGISYTNVLFFSKKTRENLYRPNYNFSLNTQSLITSYPLSLDSIMIDLNKVKKLDYQFDERFSHISDFDLMVRLSSISEIKYLDQVLSGWRIHKNNESFKRRELFNQEMEIWCNLHINNKYLAKYKKEIMELKLVVEAENRIFNYSFNLMVFKRAFFTRTNKIKNKIFIIFSFIPYLPKIIIQFKKLKFQSKWF